MNEKKIITMIDARKYRKLLKAYKGLHEEYAFFRFSSGLGWMIAVMETAGLIALVIIQRG